MSLQTLLPPWRTVGGVQKFVTALSHMAKVSQYSQSGFAVLLPFPFLSRLNGLPELPRGQPKVFIHGLPKLLFGAEAQTGVRDFLSATHSRIEASLQFPWENSNTVPLSRGFVYPYTRLASLTVGSPTPGVWLQNQFYAWT